MKCVAQRRIQPAIRIGYVARTLLLMPFVVAISLNPSSSAEGVPQAVAISPLWDFGYLPQKSVVAHTFYLKNAGTAPLSVTKIKAGCSCTSVSEIDKPIDPGDSVPIVISLKSGRYYGGIKMTTKVYTNDPETPEQHLRISAHVVKSGDPAGDLRVAPQKLTWQRNEGRIGVRVDTVVVINEGTDSLSVRVLPMVDSIIEEIAVFGHLAPNERAIMVVRPSHSGAGDDAKVSVITLAFSGQDTTLVTLPIEIKD